MYCFGGLQYNEWAVGTKLDIACISNTIQSILQVFLFDIAPNLLTLHTTREIILTTKASIERQINRLSRDI